MRPNQRPALGLKVQACALEADGKRPTEIARRLGVSKQRINQVLGGRARAGVTSEAVGQLLLEAFAWYNRRIPVVLEAGAQQLSAAIGRQVVFKVSLASPEALLAQFRSYRGRTGRRHPASKGLPT